MSTAVAAQQSTGFGSTLGNIFNRALDTAASFGTGLLELELWERANSAGVNNTATSTAAQTGTATATQTNSDSGSASNQGGLFSGLPSWAGPVGMGGGILLVILLIFALARKG